MIGQTKRKRHNNKNKTHWPYSKIDQNRPQWPWDTRLSVIQWQTGTHSTLWYWLLLIGSLSCPPVGHSAKHSQVLHQEPFSQLPQSFSRLAVMQPVRYRRRVVVQSTTGISGASLLPSMHVRHVEVEVPHTGEGVAGWWTSSNPYNNKDLSCQGCPDSMACAPARTF